MRRKAELWLWPVCALSLALGIAVGGWAIGRGFVEARSGDRVVSVKGLAERDVRSDLAVWPLRFVAAGDVLAEVRAEIERAEGAVRRFLADHALDGEAVRTASVEVTDMQARTWQSGPVASRFIVTMTLMVRTGDVDAVVGAEAEMGALLQAGVVLDSERGPQRPAYLFTRLVDLKEEMLALATTRAREAAVQFARASGSTVGPIKRAQQGVFQILPRDPVPGAAAEDQVAKTVRVVSTVDYVLLD
ncbi:MAG: SIMPL domain-containing protein [Geminicoccaceae bacterium]|nr:SIMPL domain-containing protein [Geminicoccaceae bacterium]